MAPIATCCAAVMPSSCSGEIVHGPTELVEVPIKFLSVIAYGSPRR